MTKIHFFLLFASLLVVFSCKAQKKSETDKIVFKASSKEIKEGDSTILSWKVEAGSKVSISEIGENLEETGKYTVYPKKETKYSMIVIDKKGKSKTKNVTIKVLPRFETMPIIKLRLKLPAAGVGKMKYVLSWEIKNLQPGDKIILDYIAANRVVLDNLNDSTGFCSVEDYDNVDNFGRYSEGYKVKINRRGQIIASQTISKGEMNNIPPVGFSKGPDDGRFTIGGSGVRLMYGFPIPRSTSHFVVNVDGLFAGNSPWSSNWQYISSYDKITGELGSPFIETNYHFNGVKITQKLTPVDKSFKTVPVDSFGQLYMIEYILENKTEEDRIVGLISLIDFMIDYNDAAPAEIGGKQIKNEKGYYGANVPDEVKNYCEYKVEQKGTSYTVMNKGAAVKPDEYYVGRWPYFHGCTYEIKPNGKPFGDDAEILKWAKQTLRPGDKRVFCYYFGFPYESKIQALTTKKTEERSLAIYFSPGSSSLSNDDKLQINKLMDACKGKEILGALVSGWVDATGTLEANLRVAGNRAKNTADYLSSKGIRKNKIITKAYGQPANLSGQSSDKDRKCEIVIYFK
jgi:outer membrane protein OmpA-like peptidoglycan-associated protein